MEFIAKQIADLIGGRIEGDENAVVNSFAKIEEGHEGAISFLSNPKYTHYVYDTQSSVVLIGNDVVLERPVKATLIRVANAYESVAKLLQMYQSMQPKPTGVSSMAFIDSSATIGEDCYVGAFAYIGKNVSIGKGSIVYPHAVIMDGTAIGDECTIYPNVSIYHHCKIGNRVTLHSGAVIGADGFGFAPTAEGYSKIPQIGNVVIDDDVEIGANTVMSAQAGMAGSTKIGEWCMAGGQAGFSGHIKVADKSFIGAQCGVIGNTKSGEQLIGSPAMDAKEYFRAFAVYRRLPDIYKQIGQMQKEIEKLKSGE